MKLLEQSIKKLEGLDHSIDFQISTFKKGKELKKRNSVVSTQWGTDGEVYKMIYLEEGENGTNGRELLIHEYIDKRIRTWIKYPKSGKVKEIKDKKLSKKIDISDITIPMSFLDKKHKFLSEESINGISCRVVEINNEDERIVMWIDDVDHLIHKREYYDKKSKLYKTTNYSNLITVGDITFYGKIETNYLKDKTSSVLVVNEFKIENFEGNQKFKSPK